MSKPTDCISVAAAKQLQSNWNATRGIEIEKAQGSKDVIAVTFNIDQLQEYIDYVKSEVGSGAPKKPGIRVYFAAYDNDDSDKATVFMCASDSDDGNSANNYGIDPLNRGNSGWPPNAY